MANIDSQLKTQLKSLKIDERLSRHTTFGIGGPAQYFYIAKTTPDLTKAIKLARKLNLPIFILGGGSNILVADTGIKGLVIKNMTNKIEIVKAPSTSPTKLASPVSPRFQPLKDKPSFALTKKAYDESKLKPVFVKFDSGVKIAQAIHHLLDQGITGLEWFAGIPATIGGGAYINIHGGHKFLSDYLVSAQIITPDNQIRKVSSDYFQFDYDDSQVKNSHDYVLSVTLRLFKGPVDKARDIATSWARLKSNQPQKSAGCIFQNLSLKQQKQLKTPTPSIGYLIDKLLNLKGTKIGAAQISNKHAGFIENLKDAKASDVLKLIELIKTKAKKKLNLDLKLEIVPVGF